MLRQMDAKETEAIRDFLDECADPTPGSSYELLELYMEHQRKMLTLLEKYKKEDYSKRAN